MTAFIGNLGWLGVSFFFILSGFVLMWGFDVRATYKQFVVRRLIRIWPLHLFTLLVSILAWLLVGSALAGYVGTALATVLNFFLVQGWVPLNHPIEQSWNGVAWTLSCELFFYLCAPVLFPVLLRRWSRIRNQIPVIWSLLLTLSVVATFQHWGKLLDLMRMSPIFRLFEFVVGAALAIQLRTAPFRFTKPMALSLLVIPVFTYSYLVRESRGLIVSPILIQLVVPGAALLIYATAISDVAESPSWLRRPTLIFLGDASYSLYMTHALLLGAFSMGVTPLFASALHGAVPGELMRVTYLYCAVLLSVVCYLAIEKPSRSYLLGRFAAISTVPGAHAKR